MSLLAALSCTQVQAASPLAMQKNGVIKSSVVITKPSTTLTGSAKKDVYLMDLNLTPEQKRAFFAAAHPSKALKVESSQLPEQFDMGMNGTPVLDQGRHGSCVTFAVTAALDALLGKGDYISQLCNLELGAYLEKNGYIPSGWNGSDGAIVLNQIQSFGFVTKDMQQRNSCGGLKQYPLYSESNIGSPMTPEEFKTMSQTMGEFGIFPQNILTTIGRFGFDPNYQYNADQLVNNIKRALVTEQKDGYNFRLIFATSVPVKYCSAGACGRYHAANDTWALTNAIKHDEDPKLGGHEMIITGYDDNAVVTDNEGGNHKGVFIIRNSWGSDVGDKGNYYMTYDFFKLFVLDVTKIIFPVEDNNK